MPSAPLISVLLGICEAVQDEVGRRCWSSQQVLAGTQERLTSPTTLLRLKVPSTFMAAIILRVFLAETELPASDIAAS